MKNSKETKIKFSGFNGLRFIAALLVIFGHAKLISPSLTKYDSNPIWNLFFNNASLAVSFFFVLSGFLITYLLLQEHQSKGEISIIKFYKKRALRIFPLYYGLVLMVLITIPLLLKINGASVNSYTNEKLYMYLLFLPNVVSPLAKLTHLWSIGVEEQFYLIWAPLMKYCRRILLPIILLLVITRIVLDYTVLANYAEHFESSANANLLRFIQSFQLHTMAIGALGAWLLFYFPKHIQQKWLFHPISQLLNFLLLIAAFAFDTVYFKSTTSIIGVLDNPLFKDFFIPLLFLALLLNIALNEKSLIKLKSPNWEFLGDLSFGMYMFHLPILYLLKPFFANLLYIPNLSPLFVFYTFLTISITVFAAFMSFEYFEKYFKKFRPL